MGMAKRIFLFVLTNILVLISLSIVWTIVQQVFHIEGNGYGALLVFSVVFGFGGAFISLLMSKFIAKRLMGVQVIDPHTQDPNARALVEKVHGLARAAGLSKMPEVGVYPGQEVNAFATGPSKKDSLVAVSAGLLNRMNEDEVEGVLGHEVAHIANGDMVTMTLLQGIVNAIAIFLARVLANIVANAMSKNDDRGPSFFMQFMLIQVFQTVLMLLGSLVVNWFSRQREFRADKGGARYAGKGKMVAALRRLQGMQNLIQADQPAVQTLKISGRPRPSLARLFSTHPPLEERIARLERA